MRRRLFGRQAEAADVSDGCPDLAEGATPQAAISEAPAMSRRDFGLGVALAAPAVLGAGVLDRHPGGPRLGAGGNAVVTGDTVGIHGSGGRFGVLGTSEGAGNYGVYGYADGPGSSALGGGATAPGAHGAHLGVTGAGSVAVHGEAAGEHSVAVAGVSHAGGSAGVHGVAYGEESAGVLADASPALGTAHALWSEGRAHVNGALTHSSSGFKIDHPLRPATHFLSHSVVESNERKTVYDGIATLDAQGRAVVELPEWFEALNTDLRYQLTALGSPSPDLHVAMEVRRNRFEIAGGGAGRRVSWMVTGVRRDAAASDDQLEVEAEKRGSQTGGYLRPELYGGDRSLRPGQRPG
jgi:hypothetical protein